MKFEEWKMTVPEERKTRIQEDSPEYTVEGVGDKEVPY